MRRTVVTIRAYICRTRIAHSRIASLSIADVEVAEFGVRATSAELTFRGRASPDAADDRDTAVGEFDVFAHYATFFFLRIDSVAWCSRNRASISLSFVRFHPIDRAKTAICVLLALPWPVAHFLRTVGAIP